MRNELHQMGGSRLRSSKEELESRLRGCEDDAECEKLRRRIEELEAEIRRRAHIGRTGGGSSDRDSKSDGANPSSPSNGNSPE